MEIVFQNPTILLLFLLFPIMIILHYYFFDHNKRKAMRFANFSAMRRVTGTHLITKNTSQLVLRLVAMSAIILGTANPTYFYQGQASTNDYVIAIDSSASMLSDDVLPDRITVAKQGAKSFVDRLSGQTQISVITFSGVVFIKTPLVSNKAEVMTALDKIKVEPAGGTDIGGALITASNILTSSEKNKVVILLTDGSDTAGSFIEESVETSLNYVINSNVIVHTIAIGSGLTGPGYLKDTTLKAVYDVDALKNIAERTGGRFFQAKSTTEMAAAFQIIGENVTRAKVSFEMAGLLVTFGFILLIFEWVILNTRFRAIP